MSFTLKDLEKIIGERAKADPKNSYSAHLLDKGVGHCAQKFGEEAFETVISALEKDQNGLKSEAADVLYHLLVLLRAAEVPLDDVLQELQTRTARSGIEEKLSR